MVDQSIGNVIVAIPAEDDPVWKISSEKTPHMTLLFLGDQSENPKLEQMMLFLQHAAETSLTRFGLSVDRRGTLGPDNADVLFLANFGLKNITRFRTNLLSNDDIHAAYNSVEQYPVWTPHLTLGYPTAPAKPDDFIFSPINYIRFDRISFWTGDSTGPEFELKDNDSMEVSMSDVVGRVLAHHGIKGMKWGVRRSESQLRSGPTPVTIKTTSGKKITTAGGKGHSASSEATKTAVSKQKAKASGTKSLSNKELQDAIQRMNLEKQFSSLTAAQKSAGAKFVASLLGNTAKQQASRVANDVAAQQVSDLLKKAAKS